MANARRTWLRLLLHRLVQNQDFGGQVEHHMANFEA